MKKHTLRDHFSTEEHYQRYQKEIAKIISGFENSYMNNSKWRKLFIAICERKELFSQCEIYDFLNSSVNEIVFENIDTNFQDSIHQEYMDNHFLTSENLTIYKHIEYLEFQKYWFNPPEGRLMKPQKVTQNTDIIKEYLSQIGVFMFEETEKYLRIVGYK